MQFNIDTISNQGLTVDRKEPFDTFESLLEMAQKKECQFLSPIQIRLQIRRIQQYFEVTGKLQADVRFSCSRCLNLYDYTQSTPFSATFYQAIHEPEEPEELIFEGDVEWSGDDTDTYYFQGDIIDLQGAIQEQLVLSLPVKPLCRTECKGLCNGCGADLNRTPCKCKNDKVDPRFAVLKNLKIEEK
jgi:DUF177 domain-containing protein